MSDSNKNSSGIGFCGMLTLLFIGLKLTNYIDWSWWCVLSPSIIPISFILLILLCLGLFVYFAKIFSLIKGS